MIERTRPLPPTHRVVAHDGAIGVGVAGLGRGVAIGVPVEVTTIVAK